MLDLNACSIIPIDQTEDGAVVFPLIGREIVPAVRCTVPGDHNDTVFGVAALRSGAGLVPGEFVPLHDGDMPEAMLVAPPPRFEIDPSEIEPFEEAVNTVGCLVLRPRPIGVSLTVGRVSPGRQGWRVPVALDTGKILVAGRQRGVGLLRRWTIAWPDLPAGTHRIEIDARPDRGN